MTFKQVAAFAAVAKHLNLTRAAQALRTNQPAVSKQIKNLQEEFKLALVARSGKGIKLTEAGHEFLHHIEPILAQLERIDRRYRSALPQKSAGSLRVGGTYGPSSGILPSLLTVFKKSHPAVEVTLRTNDVRFLERMISSGELEIAVTANRARSPELAAEPFTPMKLAFFVSRNHPVARKGRLKAADLEKIPLIVRTDQGQRGPTENLLSDIRERGYRPHVAMVCDSPEAIKLAVSEGMGAGILYYDSVKHAIARGAFKQLDLADLNLEKETYILYREERSLSRAAAEFLKLLRRWRDRRINRKPKGKRTVKRLPPLTHKPQLGVF